jgi:hypothetical protein
MRPDAGERFASELAVLRDSVVRALRQDNVSDLKEGSELYTSLVRTVLEQFRHYEAIAGTGGSGLFSFYGREMSWLEDDVRTFLSNGVLQPGSDASQEVLGFTLGLVKLALEQRELPAFGAFLRHFTLAWNEGRNRNDDISWRRLRANLLLTLENFGDFWIGRDLRNAAARTEVTPYAKRLLAEITQLMKISVDNGAAEDLKAAAHTLRETMRHALDEVEVVDEPSRSESSPQPLDLSALKGAAVLAVEAWIRFRHKHEKTGVDDARDLLAALRSAPAAIDWASYEAARDHSTSDLLGWSWWESGLWEERRGGVLTFDSYVTETFARALLSGRARVPTSVDEGTPSLKYQVRELQEHVKDIATTRPDPLVAATDRVHDSALVESALSSLISQLQLADDRALVALPLVPGHIATFRTAVTRAWTDARHLRRLGSSSSWDPTTTEAAEPGGFGINRLCPKDYFVDQPAVHADPSDLGREFGNAVGRGEDELILITLRTLLPVRQTTMESLPRDVAAATQDLLARGLRPTVLVLNSWELLEALRPIIEPEGRWATADLEDATRLQRTATPVLLRYAGVGDACIVADFQQAFEVLFRHPVVERPGDDVDGRLLIGVDPIDKAQARTLLDANPSLRRQHDTELEPDAALLNLQKSVHVRVLEWITITAGAEDSGFIFEVPETA